MHSISHITILSAGKVMSSLMALVAIIYSLFFLLISLALGAFPGLLLWQKALFFAFMLFIFPALNAVAGFISGSIIAVIYNLIAKHFGGLVVELTPETETKKQEG